MVPWLPMLAAVGLLVAGVGGFGVGVYAADYEVQATIVGKECAGPEPPGYDQNGTAPPDQPSGRAPDGARPDADQRPAPPGADRLAPGANSTVTVAPRVLGFTLEVEVTEFPDDKCWPLRPGQDGNFVTYNVRTERVVFYEREGGACIFDSLFGLGCVLPEPPVPLDQLPRDNVSFTLSTSGYSDAPVGLPGSGAAANCAILGASDLVRANVTAAWQPGATDDELVLRLRALDDAGTVLLEETATAGPPIALGIALPSGTTALEVAMFPGPDETLGSTGAIGVSVAAVGADDLAAPEPAPCRG